MYFHNLTEFILMGKHGIYVWSSWGIVFVVIIGLIIHSYQQRQALIKELLVRKQRKISNSQ